MNKRVLLLLTVLVVLLAAAGIAYKSLSADVEMDNLSTGETVSANVPEASEEAPAQELAPDFTVYDREGNAHSLSDFRGQPVIVNFWASWCGPCKSEMPDFEEKFREYGEEIQFLMVNLTDGHQETVESASSFVDGQGYTFPVYFDSDYSGAAAYAVNAVPATYFIDAEGVLVAYGKGAMSAEVLQKGIDMLIG
ncbi:MAG: TlpA family protein disulfide reductase [Oscillospiraceae bacterium]|nr:TlpA family protein disulfide reductase [Oscillospiraceae bacterium]